MDCGKYIVFEGPDRSGKSTQLEIIYGKLIKSNYDVVKVSEPSKLRTGEFLREMLTCYRIDKKAEAMRDAFLFFADRVWLYASTIKPEINKGKIVLSDRNYLSTLAYEGFDEGYIREYRATTEWLIHKGLLLRPDLTLVFKISDKEFVRRIKGKIEKYEIRAFQKKVRENYARIPEISQERIEFIDGEGSKREVTKRVVKKLADRFGDLMDLKRVL